jgi:hypothetical protein
MTGRWAGTLAFLAIVISLTFETSARAEDADCGTRLCPQVKTSPGALTAADVHMENGLWVASNSVSAPQSYTYQLSEPCVVDDRNTSACRKTDFRDCPSAPDRVVEDLILERRRLVIADATGTGSTTIDGYDPQAEPLGAAVGPWMARTRACVDITALNPPPSPAEVFRYFKTLPLPQLTAQHQPPGDGLSGLPVIFYTDDPVTQTFTLDIRGFTVNIVAGATTYTWHTGDGADVTSADPGAAYPNQTVTHDYRSGTYTAYLTTTWGATFSVDGGASVAVPGTTTTDGPPVTFAVRQAHAVLTNPYD